MRVAPENLDGFGNLFGKAADTLRAGFSVAALSIEKAAAVQSGTAPASSLAITSAEIKAKAEEIKKAESDRLRAEMQFTDEKGAKARSSGWIKAMRSGKGYTVSLPNEADKAKAQKTQILIVGGVVAAVLLLSRK